MEQNTTKENKKTKYFCLILITTLLMNFMGTIPVMAVIGLPLKQGADKSELEQAQKKAQIPLFFEANQGQADAPVKFLARSQGYNLFLTSSEVVLNLPGDVVHMGLKGAKVDPVVQGLDLLPSQSNYMTGNDQRKWHTNVKQYSKVEYQQVYPGIDVIYYGNQGQLEYDFVIAPGANPGLISMDFKGAKSLGLDQMGNLVLSLKAGQMAFGAPTLYQKKGNAKAPVKGSFVMADNGQVCFAVGAYDKSKELIIDPIVYSTYIGTTVEDRVNAMEVDAAGNVYLTGQTAVVADLFPGTAGHFQSSNHGGAFDVFVTKLSPTGAIVWSTYLGGAGNDLGKSIAVDGSGIVYITGSTTSVADYPTTSPYQAVNAGGTDAFITAIAADGNSLIYSTYLGGSGVEFGNGITVNNAGDAYVTGGTDSDNSTFTHPVGGFQGNNGGIPAVPNAFVTKFNAAGVPQYFSYLGGSVTGGTQGNAITIDGTGNAYVTGFCRDTFPTFPSGVLPLARAFKLTIGGAQDAFVSKISPSGANLLYSSYLGGSGMSQGTGIKLDSTGNVYVAGDNDSGDFPDAITDGVTVGFAKVGQMTIVGNYDCFIFKITMNATGHSDGVYCTFLGGSGLDHLNALKVDSFGNAYVTGRTESSDFLTVSPLSIQTPLDSVLGATAKVFMTVIGTDGSTRVLNTYIGGVTDQEGKGIAIDGGGNIYVAGWTNSAGLPGTGFPTAGSAPMPLFSANAGSYDGFVMKISASAPVVPIETVTATPTITETPNASTTITVTPTSTIIATSSPVVSSSYFDPYIYPSPATGITSGIAYFMTGSGVVNIRIYSEIGVLVETLEENKSAGPQVSNISIGKLAPGIYFYLLKIKGDDGSTKKFSSRKFVVIR